MLHENENFFGGKSTFSAKSKEKVLVNVLYSPHEKPYL